MKSVVNSLSSRLFITLFLLLSIISIGYVILMVSTTRLYFQEVTQKLNREVAALIVKETELLKGDDINNEALDKLFYTLMVVNPSIEFYLVDVEGKILAYNAPPGKVVRKTVSLEPINNFITAQNTFPILGDDPRDSSRKKAFSAAPLMQGDVLKGYLYIVLGGEFFDSMTTMISDSYILRITIGIAVACLFISLVLGFLSFNWLTRRLRHLSRSVARFRHSNFINPIELTPWRKDDNGDEIDQLGINVVGMSDQIIDQISQLRDAEVMRKEMLANISYDLRTPLTSLNGYLETLRMKEGTVSDEERRSYLDLAAKNAKNVNHLVAQIFELVSLESGGLKPSLEPFSLSELIHDVAQKFQPILDGKQMQFDLQLPESMPFVSADIALIERVLDNLIENAIKYTKNGGLVKLSLKMVTDGIEMQVSDTGIGIEPKDLVRIFDRFYRSEGRVDGKRPQGTGLGLAISQSILQLHNTVINVKSRPGYGSTFSFELPHAI